MYKEIAIVGVIVVTAGVTVQRYLEVQRGPTPPTISLDLDKLCAEDPTNPECSDTKDPAFGIGNNNSNLIGNKNQTDRTCTEIEGKTFCQVSENTGTDSTSCAIDPEQEKCVGKGSASIGMPQPDTVTAEDILKALATCQENPGVFKCLNTRSLVGVNVDGDTKIALDVSREQLATLQTSDLVALYKAGQTFKANDGVLQSNDILNEIIRRQQSATTVVGELFPDMTYDTEHNALLTVARGTRAQAKVELSEMSRSMMADTMEPVVIEKTETKSSRRVGAELMGAGFEIEPKGIVWRTIPDGREDTFTWKVTPKREGDLQLFVILRNEIIVGDETVDLPVGHFPKSITVSVGFWTKFGRFFAGVDTAVGTAKNIGVAVAALFGFGGIGAFYAGISAWRKCRNAGTG